MNILFFTYDFPYPTNSGGKTRAYNLLKYGKKDSKIVLFSFTRSGFQAQNKKELSEIGIDTMHLFPRRSVADIRNITSFITARSIFYSLYYDQEIEKKLIEVVKKEEIDLVHFESFYTGYYINQALRDLGVKQIFGTENIEHVLYKEYVDHSAPLLLRALFSSQVEKLEKEEKQFYEASDHIISVSLEEKKYIGALTGKHCTVIENGIHDRPFSVKKHGGKTLLFIGNFSYFPNVDAMQFFMHKVFPNLPLDFQLVVIGKKSTTMTLFKHERVVAHEFVTDIGVAYQDADVFVSPLRFGGGTNFKILEAMVNAIPIVSFKERVRGIGCKDGRDILIAKDAADFVTDILQITGDKELSARLVKNAYSFVTKHFLWEDIGNKLHKTWSDVTHEKH